MFVGGYCFTSNPLSAPLRRNFANRRSLPANAESVEVAEEVGPRVQGLQWEWQGSLYQLNSMKIIENQ